MGVGARRRGRQTALAVLFQREANPLEPDEALARVLEAFPAELQAPAPSVDFARELVTGVAAHAEALDEAIRAASFLWRVERMGRIDRNILRLAAFELLHQPETPARVILDEAIELAKRYGGEESRSFVNGVLDGLARSSRGEEDVSEGGGRTA